MPFVAQDSVQCVGGIQLIFVEKIKQLNPRDLTIDSGNLCSKYAAPHEYGQLLEVNKSLANVRLRNDFMLNCTFLFEVTPILMSCPNQVPMCFCYGP